MAILTVKTVQTGLVGVLPSIAYMNTTNTIAEVTTTGFLNKEVANGASFSLPCMAIVSTKASASSAPVVGVYNVQHSGADWSLTLGSNDSINLANTHILVGNASGIATDVAMSGDATIDNTGAVTLANIITKSAFQIDGTLLTYKDNATSFRLKGPSSPNDPSAGADVQTYSGMFYNDSYSNFGVLKTRATFGANTQMDLVLQAPRGLLLIAYDGTQVDGVIKMASQTTIEFAPRSSAVSAPGNYAYFDNLDETVDSGAAVSLNSHASHLYLQYGKTTQAIVLPTIASGSLAGAVAGTLFYDTGTNKLMFYNGSGLETVTSS